MIDPINIEPLIIGQYGDLVVINKPFGWKTAGLSLEDADCIQFHIMKYFGKMVWAIHQLDADTSGLCLFSLSKKLVTDVKSLWSDPLMRKEYLAIVTGEPEWDRVDEHSPIGKVSERSLGVCPQGKVAHTSFEVLDRSKGFSLVKAHLYTGRTHQIRIHLSHLGFPLVGEEWYVEPPCQLHQRQALHAQRICFPRNDILDIDVCLAPVADDFVELGQRLGLTVAK